MTIRPAASIAAAFAARFPHAGGTVQPGNIDSIQAGAQSGAIESIQAGAVRGFAAAAEPLQWVKALQHFYVAGEFNAEGDFVQVLQSEAKQLVHSGRAQHATEDEVAAAATKSKAKG